MSLVDEFRANLKSSERMGSRYVAFTLPHARMIVDIVQAASDWHQVGKAGSHDKMAELRCLVALRDCLEQMEGGA